MCSCEVLFNIYGDNTSIREQLFPANGRYSSHIGSCSIATDAIVLVVFLQQSSHRTPAHPHVNMQNTVMIDHNSVLMLHYQISKGKQ